MKRNVKIILVAINLIQVDKLSVPLSLLYLRSSLLKDREAKRRVKIVLKEYTIDLDHKNVARDISRQRPDIVGFSTFAWNCVSVLKISSELKKIDPGLKIVLGGPEVSPIASDIMAENQQIDFIIRGEGEFAFLDLVKTLIKNKDPAKIKGLTFRKNGMIVKNPDRLPMGRLDLIPSPYGDPFIKKFKEREIPIETQRGCPFKCDFCYYGKSFDAIRYFSMARVKKDLRSILKIKPFRAYLMDPVFNVNLKRAREISSFLARVNRHGTPFHTELRAELVNEKLAGLMEKACINLVEIGLQTTSESALRSCRRDLNLRKFENGIKILDRHGIKQEVHLIAGLPGETFGSFIKSFDRLFKIGPNVITTFLLQVLPGTRLWENAAKLGMVFQQKPPHYIISTKKIPPEGIRRLNMFSMLALHLRNLFTFRQLCKDIDIKLSEFVLGLMDWADKKNIDLYRSEVKTLKKHIAEFIKETYITESRRLDGKFYETLIKEELGEVQSKSSCSVSRLLSR